MPKGEGNSWRRGMFYLVAGLWALHWAVGRTGAPISIGKACAFYQSEKKSTSTERRFIALLDADCEQLPHRLRQMIALLKERTIDFDILLERLLYWNDDRKRTQTPGRVTSIGICKPKRILSLTRIGEKQMKTIVEIHALQNCAPSNLNRDDTGAPKDAFFGGVRRARVSSQCFKRAVRQHFADS